MQLCNGSKCIVKVHPVELESTAITEAIPKLCCQDKKRADGLRRRGVGFHLAGLARFTAQQNQGSDLR